MSNGGNVIDQIRALAPDPAILETAIGGFRAVPTGDLPLAQIGQIVSRLSGVALPNGAQAAAERQAGLQALLTDGISSPDALLSATTGQFDQLQELLETRVLGALNGVFGPFAQAVRDAPADPAALLAGARGPLVAALDTLTKDTRLLGLQRYAEQIAPISDLLGASPQELVTLIQGQLQQSSSTTTGPVDRSTAGSMTALTGAAADYDPASLAAELQGLRDVLTPAGGPSLAEQIGALDVADAAAVTALLDRLESARNRLTALANLAGNNLAAALRRFDNVSGETLVDSLQVAYEAIGALNVEPLSEVGAGLREALGGVEQTLAAVDPDALLQPLRSTLEPLRTALQGADLQQVQTTVVQGLSEAGNLVDQFGRLQIQLVTALHRNVAAVTDGIAQIDLSGLVDTAQQAIDTLDPLITEVNAAIGAVDAAIDGLLTTISGALDDLSGTLLDENTGVRRRFEDALNAAVAALEGLNLPQIIADMGAALAQALERLNALTFDPVVAEVLAGLEDTREKLDGIDTSQINDILREALRVALTVVIELGERYEGEVRAAILSEFDDLVQTGVTEPFAFAREKFAELFGEVEVLDPAFLIRDSGLISLHQTLVRELDQFRPGSVLAGVDEEFTALRARLDEFAPERYLGGIGEQFQQLRTRVDGLAPGQLLDPLEQALAGLRDQVAAVDVAGFAGGLRSNLTAVTGIVQGLSFDGVRAALETVYRPVRDALDPLDPQQLLGPFATLRQRLLDAIAQADLSALGDVFQTTGERYDQAGLDSVRDRLRAAIDAAEAALGQADPTAFITQLRLPIDAVRAAAAALPDNPRKAEIVAAAQALDVFAILSGPVERFEALQDRLDDLRGGVENTAATTGPLATAAQSAAARFADLRPPELDPGVAIADAVTGVIEGVFANLGLDAIQSTYNALVATVERFAPDNLLAPLQGLADELVQALEAIGDPEVLIGALDTAHRELLDALDGVSFAPIQAELNSAFTQLTAQLDNLDPAPLVATIGARFDALVATADTVDLTGIRTRLDGIFQTQVADKLPALDPQTVLIEPLEAAFARVLDLVQALDIDVVLDPVAQRLTALREDLDQALRQVGQALADVLRAVAAILSGSGTGAGVAIG